MRIIIGTFYYLLRIFINYRLLENVFWTKAGDFNVNFVIFQIVITLKK